MNNRKLTKEQRSEAFRELVDRVGKQSDFSRVTGIGEDHVSRLYNCRHAPFEKTLQRAQEAVDRYFVEFPERECFASEPEKKLEATPIPQSLVELCVELINDLKKYYKADILLLMDEAPEITRAQAIIMAQKLQELIKMKQDK